MKGSNLSISGSGTVNSSKTWVGRTLGRNKVAVTSSTLPRQYEVSKLEEEDPEVPSATFTDFWNASMLMSNTMGSGPISSGTTRVSNVRTFSTRAFTANTAPTVSLQSHRSRGPSTAQDFAFMTQTKNTTQAMSLIPLSEALVTLSDILSISLFALIRWWKHRVQSHILQHPIFQFDSYIHNYHILQQPFSLQLIPRTQNILVENQVTYGLKNHGQTCFLNSVIQALASLPPIIAYLESIALEQHLHLPSASIVSTNSNNGLFSNDKSKAKGPSLTEMVLGLLSSVGATSPRFHIAATKNIDTRDVLQKVGEKHMQFHSKSEQDRSHLVQQDAQEFLQALMDMIVSEAEEVMGKSDNLIMPMKKENTGHLSLNSSQISQTSTNVDSSSLHSSHQNSNYDECKNTPVSLDNLLDYVLDQQHIQHQQKVQFIEDKKQTEAKKMLSQFDRFHPPQSSSDNDEKKNDKWDHDENLRNAMETSKGPLHSASNHQDQILDGDNSDAEPASMRMLNSLSSTTPSPLSGWVGSLLQCNRCHHVRPIQNAPFLDIPLVPTTNISWRHRGQRPVCSLEQCLSAFSKVERVQNVECYNCARIEKVKELEEEIDLLKGGIQSRLDERKKKFMQNGGNDTDFFHSKQDFDVDGLQSQLLECQQRFEYFKNLDPDDINSEKLHEESNVIHDDLTVLNDVLTQDQKLLSPPPRGLANKCLLLTRLPSILCFHVQRRFYDGRLNRMLKSSSHVDFPEILDISSYCAYGNGGSITTQKPSIKNENEKEKIEYRLMSAVEHNGNANCGHYQTYRRVGGSRNDDKWALISDENMKEVDWNVVKNCQAYLLFYEAI